MKNSNSMMLRSRALTISKALGRDGADYRADAAGVVAARDAAVARRAPESSVDVRSKIVDPTGLVRDGLLPSATFDGFTAAQLNIIPSKYDESPAEFLAAMRALFAVPSLQTNNLFGTGVVAGGTVTVNVNATTPGPVAVPGVRIEIGVGPFTTGIGQATVTVNGRATSLAAPAPADALTAQAQLLVSPRAGVICVARALFGVPNLWGRRTRVPLLLSGAQPTLYTPGEPPVLPAVAQQVAVPIQIVASGLPDGTIVNVWPLIPGSPFFEADIASLIGSAA